MMHQISEYVYADDALLAMSIPTKRLSNPYAPYPYLYLSNVLDEALCEAITTHARQEAIPQEALLRDQGLNTALRNTFWHTLPSEYVQRYHRALDRVRERIEAFFAISLGEASALQVLGYGVGSLYHDHADDSSQLLDSSGRVVGFLPKAPERKVTSVAFANDNFEGGVLRFSYLYDVDGSPIVLTPKRGDMILFLSNPYFSHAVEEVKHGYRVTLVQWHNGI